KGADASVIGGARDPASTNGSFGVRCAWLTDGAILCGFTLRDGATRSAGDLGWLQSGGAVFASSTNATVIHCVLSNNAAAYGGGGAYQGLISNSKLVNNHASYGGGAFQSVLQNSYVAGNSCSSDGAGVHSAILINCTVSGNVPPPFSSAVYQSTARNSIIYYNYNPFDRLNQVDWGPRFSTPNFSYCCAPGVSGSGNIASSPQLFYGLYLSSSSPCRGAGSSLYAAGTDIDGEPWMNPPS